jgi:non-specific serine/threonine protein kinase
MAAPVSSLPENFPQFRTRLIGREADVATARSLLLEERVPLLTLTGPGGVGKTRLALAIAQDVADHFADGLIWVDLAPLTAPSLVLSTVADVLPLVSVSGQSLHDAIIQRLRTRQTVLLLDNCEHLLASVAELVAALLRACPTLQVLATSRAPLSLRAEQVVPVAPLPVPAGDCSLAGITESDAVRLFVERAHARDPSFTLTDANATAIAAICQRLDGLPLAIELVAARVPAMPPSTLFARLERFPSLMTLTSGPRDAPARHRTMRETIAWSYDLLEPEERCLFQRLAVFVGGVGLEAAATVCSGTDGGDVFEGVSALVDKSFLHPMATPHEAPARAGGAPPPTDTPRFAMLETIREYGWERLEASGEEAVVRNRHAAWCLGLVERYWVHEASWVEEPGWLVYVAPEHDNAREALAWMERTGDGAGLLRLAGALQPFWDVRAPALRRSPGWSAAWPAARAHRSRRACAPWPGSGATSNGRGTTRRPRACTRRCWRWPASTATRRGRRARCICSAWGRSTRSTTTRRRP